ADGLSRMYTTTDPVPGDSGEWTVSKDWEQARGIVHDLFTVDSVDLSIQALRKRFANEPLFHEVVDTIYNLDHDKSIREKRRARHRAKLFFINSGKLWRIPNDTSTRVHSRLECVTQAEAVELARAEHANRGHWGRDMIKLQLMDRIYSPRLDRSITTAI
ncbi:hypothetical protein BV22DRAFT_984950, partial [Leucogyrophana mollusca]